MRGPHVDVRVPPHGKATGCLPRTTRPGERFAVAEDVEAPIPRDEWSERLAEMVARDRKPWHQVTKDQDGEGSCTSNATSGWYEHMLVDAFGEDAWVETSPISLYRRCASGPNSGSSLDCNLRELCDGGILPTDNAANRERFAHVHPNIGYYTALPAGWEETAVEFRADEFLDVTTFDGLVSAILRGRFVVYARASHCILGVSLRYQGGVWYLKYLNSWGAWGADGYGYDSESYVSGSIRTYGAFASGSIVVPRWLDLPVPR